MFTTPMSSTNTTPPHSSSVLRTPCVRPSCSGHDRGNPALIRSLNAGNRSRLRAFSASIWLLRLAERRARPQPADHRPALLL